MHPRNERAAAFQARETPRARCIAGDAGWSVCALLIGRRMAQPRIRDFVTFLTTLPASTMIAVCLFLPHTQTCRGTVETPFESGTWIVIAPIVIVGLLPVAWRALPRIRRETPELVLTITM